MVHMGNSEDDYWELRIVLHFTLGVRFLWWGSFCTVKALHHKIYNIPAYIKKGKL